MKPCRREDNQTVVIIDCDAQLLNRFNGILWRRMKGLRLGIYGERRAARAPNKLGGN